MTNTPEFKRALSLHLSEILGEIGLNKQMVLKRRRASLLNESIWTNSFKVLHENPNTVYRFGSQSEGTTTPGLKSDSDLLMHNDDFYVIHDWSDWKPGKVNLLIVQDNTTSPGYCLLQVLDPIEPTPISPSQLHLVPSRYLVVKGERLLLSNSYRGNKVHLYKLDNNGRRSHLVRNGPAETFIGLNTDTDYVTAFNCNKWPDEAEPWLKQQEPGQWPTKKMKKHCAKTGCFVVPVSSKIGVSQDLEWRISTSHAERLLMFSLNISQIRCYVLMKMVVKTYINPHCGNVLTSFMCKNVLLMSIQNKGSDIWQDHNLFPCLNSCILMLQNCVSNNNCPHFIIPGNNLMAGKFSLSVKRKILEILQRVIDSQGMFLLGIFIDSLGARLYAIMTCKRNSAFPNYPYLQDNRIATELLCTTASHLQFNFNSILLAKQHYGGGAVSLILLKGFLTFVERLTKNVNSIEKSANKLLATLACNSLASHMASRDISTTNTLSPFTLALFSAGLNTDVSSGRLKLASALFCIREILKTEFVLKQTLELYDSDSIQSVCSCIPVEGFYNKRDFDLKASSYNEEGIQHTIAYCVKFPRSEMNITPQELQYEMFRSTQEEIRDREVYYENWMDWAVVDSLPYLYFLQYKTYTILQKETEKHRALGGLISSIETELNLRHKETALNLLGQCLENEQRYTEALQSYSRSLCVRRKNNVARIHLCRVLNMLINKKAL